MNSFCNYCVGSVNDSEYIIKTCNDRFCPFYNFRFADLSHDDEKEISKLLLNEIGVTI